ncbi:thymidine kinase [Occultella glacieicola]|uniref:Thymidine kinase n=1 Tax=Occultella glacieicola TaxID=2518684 RepID=A0ABY2E5A3_9MICO|nr:thymidine kinase [Occultella glacieicola]TDE90866.1 thymidine kinase [Occultella glacieicola]
MRTETGPAGRIEVVCGPMFAGKSEELLRRVRRARLAGLEVTVVNHALDERHGTGTVSSHTGQSTESHMASGVPALLDLLAGRAPDLVAVDEAQFFGPDLLEAATELAGRGIVVVVAGLSVTFDARPFEPLPALMAVAESVTKLTAVCAVCGRDAAFHQRVRAGAVGDAMVPGAEHVGGIESYQARCRLHLETS